MQFCISLKITNEEDNKNIISAIERLTPEVIEKNNDIKLSDEIAIVRRAVTTYAENLAEVDLPVSEAAFDNAFPNMLAKRFLDKKELNMDVHAVLGATNVLRLGRLSRTKMPNTLKTLAFLESFYALMSDVKPLTVMSLHFQVTLKTICDHANNVSLSHSRAHSKRKRKDLVQIDEQRWSFGELPTTPAKNSRP
ncbi:hypothetical protein BC938DRAFT_480337 [Jimgerdemannia flammicorona]|uniref:Uncharacterized protein n=1 Tax=Jimgerdemannia flammicorona TaxID=994334 RepID=A0A433QXF1_9FUNG|nr:hypothetical protein BC938DRAFT_480337 [Jimgerdemannia flammicorona]